MNIINKIRKWFYHVFNPLHIYCRMRDIGVEDCKARSIGKKYECYIYRPIFLGCKLKGRFTRRRNG